MSQTTQTLRHEDLIQFTGSTSWYRHALNRNVIYTDGVRYLADQGAAYWLVDKIASYIGGQEFQRAAADDVRISHIHFWKLIVEQDRWASLIAVADTGEWPFFEEQIYCVDFPLSEVSIWAQNNGHGYTLMLPSEY